MSYYYRNIGWIRCALNYGRDHIERYCQAAMPYHDVLDIGAGSGDDLAIALEISPEACVAAVEVDPGKSGRLRAQGVTVFQIDIERERIPLPDGSQDLIIINQVLEHIKDIYWVFHEATRVLRVGGKLVIGVPNLASLHNRILLALGIQPTSIKVNSAHVRGFTRGSILEYLQEVFPGGYELVDFRGANFYPFPPALAKPLAAVFPSLAWGMFLLFEKKRSYERQFLDAPVEQELETNYFVGEIVKVALVHDFLFEYAGSERVLEQILQLYPEADLYSVIDFLGENERGFLQGRRARTTFIQRLPLLRRNPPRYLPYAVPLMPLAIEQLDMRGYDLVISSSHSVAKGVLTGPDQLHISYVHSPMRYAWDQQSAYLGAGGPVKGLLGPLARLALSYLRMWDARTANGVDRLIANSSFVGRRIWKAYRRESTVVYPPVDVDAFPLEAEKEDYYLVVSRLVPYKRVDSIAAAFRAMPGRRLVIAGSGPERERIERLAGPNVQLLGFQPAPDLRRLVQRARGLIIAAEEDFGIAPVEAQAAGTPVIAYTRGGAAETVRGLDDPRPTGIFFPEQDPDSIAQAVNQFELVRGDISPLDCRENALRFSPGRFREEFQAIAAEEWARFQGGSALPASFQLKKEIPYGR